MDATEEEKKEDEDENGLTELHYKTYDVSFFSVHNLIYVQLE